MNGKSNPFSLIAILGCRDSVGGVGSAELMEP